MDGSNANAGKSDPNERHEPDVNSKEMFDLDFNMALALQLQCQLEERDEELARQINAQQNSDLAQARDEEIAFGLQAQLIHETKAEAELNMVSTHSGKAWKFVEEVLELHKQLQAIATDCELEPVAVDDMVFLAEALLKTQEEFFQAGKPVHVDIGYHYTRKENMTRIKTNGLLTRAERNTNGITSKNNGARYGDGVYTGNDRGTFQTFGDVGLIVARLHGSVSPTHAPDASTNAYDTVSPTDSKMAVLRTSSQCLALMNYSTAMVDPANFQTIGGHAITMYHHSLQSIVTKFFNGGLSVQKLDRPLMDIPDLTGFSSFQVGQKLRKPAPARKKKVSYALPVGWPISVKPAPAPVSSSSPAAQSQGLQPMQARQNQGKRVPFLPNAQASQNPRGPLGLFFSPVMQNQGSPCARTPPATSATTTVQANGRDPCSHSVPPSGQNFQNMFPRAPPGRLNETLRYDAPAGLNHGVDPSEIFRNVHQSCASNDDCAICLMSLQGTQRVASLRVCGHEFHFSCINDALQHFKTCPTCRKAIGAPQGMMPSGTMHISSSTKHCGDFAGGTITIDYTIEGGMQKSYHSHPGTAHGDAHRVAYLPDNTDSHKLLKRLKFAFYHGLTFTVGTSLSNGKSNQVTWASIHHKTSPSAGAHGFPDPNYFANCNRELDTLNVPPSESL